MDHDFVIMNQRSRRFCMKQILQMMLLLLVCVWLLYQINWLQAHGREGFGRRFRNFQEHEILLLGRKAILSSSWSNRIAHFAAESENGTDEGKSRRRESDQEVQGINHEKDETERFFYRFHDENGVPYEEGNETEPYYAGNDDSGFDFRKEMVIRSGIGEMNTREAIIFSGDVNDIEGDSENSF